MHIRTRIAYVEYALLMFTMAWVFIFRATDLSFIGKLFLASSIWLRGYFKEYPIVHTIPEFFIGWYVIYETVQKMISQGPTSYIYLSFDALIGVTYIATSIFNTIYIFVYGTDLPPTKQDDDAESKAIEEAYAYVNVEEKNKKAEEEDKEFSSYKNLYNKLMRAFSQDMLLMLLFLANSDYAISFMPPILFFIIGIYLVLNAFFMGNYYFSFLGISVSIILLVNEIVHIFSGHYDLLPIIVDTTLSLGLCWYSLRVIIKNKEKNLE